MNYTVKIDFGTGFESVVNCNVSGLKFTKYLQTPTIVREKFTGSIDFYGTDYTKIKAKESAEYSLPIQIFADGVQISTNAIVNLKDKSAK